MPQQQLLFRNRNEAGRLLAERVAAEFDHLDCVFFLPRGGVEIAAPIALRFNCPISPVFVAKLRHPFQPEYAIGAVDENGTCYVTETRILDLPVDAYEDAVRRARNSVLQHKQIYGSFVPEIRTLNPVILLVDDGLATGESARTAARFLRGYNPEALTLAVPCASLSGYRLLETECDEIITVLPPNPDFTSVAEYYEDFSDVEHATVLAMLQRINLKSAA